MITAEQLKKRRERRKYHGLTRTIWNPPFKEYNRTLRWCEDTYASGLRFVGKAHEVARMDHTGWYVDASHHNEPVGKAHEVARMDHTGWYVDAFHHNEMTVGLVFRLTSRDRKERYMAATSDPHNPGAAIFDMDIYDCEISAAHAADDLGRYISETEREESAKQMAEQDIEDAHEELKRLRGRIKETVKEIKANRALLDKTALLSALTEKVCDWLGERREQFNVIQERRDDYWTAVPRL